MVFRLCFQASTIVILSVATIIIIIIRCHEFEAFLFNPVKISISPKHSLVKPTHESVFWKLKEKMKLNYQVLEGAPKVKVGDTVVISLDEETLEKMQVGHGGWSNHMKFYLGKKGKVQGIDSNGDVEIKFENTSCSFFFNPNVVAKVLSFGDAVTITSQIEKVKFLHQETWNESMVKAYNTCTIHQALEPSSFETDDQMPSVGTSQQTELYLNILKKDEEPTKEELEKGADINETDEDGNTALHIAVIKNFHQTIQFLISKGATEDILNKRNQAPIHIAVTKNSEQCVKELLNSINIEDNDGNTALGLAIMLKKSDIIEILLSHKNIDFTKTNKEGKCAFHLAATEGDVKTMMKILENDSVFVDIQINSGFSALHFAAMYDKFDVAEKLIKKGKAKLNIKTINGSTPLMLAALGNHLSIVKLLVSEGADINAQDNDGNTALHAALDPKCTLSSFLEQDISYTPEKYAIDSAIHLVENGATLDIQNKKNMKPLDMLDDDSLKKNLQERAKQSQTLNVYGYCMLCSTAGRLVKFEPCGHFKLCVECESRNREIKLCMECKLGIISRVIPEMKNQACKSQEANAKTSKNMFQLGDSIQLLKDIEKIKRLQEKHGVWSEDMREIIYKIGEVIKIEEHLLTVKFDTKTYYINPKACNVLKKSVQETARNGCDNLSRCSKCQQTRTVNMECQNGHIYCVDCNSGKCPLC
ncbi:MIB [Acanthosepion pharaonis]|uniref:RING-type E3 ubiquitin transferase n=1 Tax=Acanthosepion pharaonis TaxID=158019 RepID=A0A812CXN5_ACAPH|nr:MIB [Sepia pharaonis]